MSISDKVFIDDGFVVLKTSNGSEYDIGLPLCNTVEKTKEWVQHLSRKTWVTSEMLEEFKRLIANEFNLDL